MAKKFDHPEQEWIVETEATVRMKRSYYVTARTPEEAEAKRKAGDFRDCDDGLQTIQTIDEKFVGVKPN